MLRLIQSIEFQAQALLLRGERQRLLASNIANADTPGYVARDFDFPSALRAASSSADGAAAPAPVVGSTDRDPLPTEGELLYARTSQDGLDNTKVDMDRERASWVENAVKYEAALRFINGQARALLDAMKPSNQA